MVRQLLGRDKKLLRKNLRKPVRYSLDREEVLLVSSEV